MNDTAPVFERSALITIDVQNDFVLDGAPAQIPGTMEAVPNIVKLTRCYRNLGWPIVHVVRIYLPDGSNADLCRRAMLQNGAAIALPGSRGAELVEDLKPSPSFSLDAQSLLRGQIQKAADSEIVIYKPRWGAFYNTPLADYLRGQYINTLVFCGCNYPNCPRTSVYEAGERDFRLVLAVDAVSGLYEKGCEEMENIGVVLLTTDRIVQRIADEQRAGVPRERKQE